MSLFLIRHGSTQWNAETPGAEKLRGWHDVPLATAGLIVARQAARALAGRSFTKLYTSDLRRAYDTARIMSVTLATPVEPTRDLRPWNLGDYAGREVAHVAPELTAFANGKRASAVPGGESFNSFLSRWRVELKRLLHEAQQSDVHIGAVTHARNLYALNEILFDQPIPVVGPPHPGAVLELNGPWGKVAMRYVFKGDMGTEGAGS